MSDRFSRPSADEDSAGGAQTDRAMAARTRSDRKRVGSPDDLDSHALLVSCRLDRLSRIDRVSGESTLRYEHPHPESMTHVAHHVREFPARSGIDVNHEPDRFDPRTRPDRKE